MASIHTVALHPGGSNLQQPGYTWLVGKHGMWGLLNACGPTKVLEQLGAFLEYFCLASACLGSAREILLVNK